MAARDQLIRPHIKYAITGLQLRYEVRQDEKLRSNT